VEYVKKKRRGEMAIVDLQEAEICVSDPEMPNLGNASVRLICANLSQTSKILEKPVCITCETL